MQGVRLDRKARLLLDLLEEMVGKENVEVVDGAGLGAGEVAVGVGAIAIETATGPLDAFDHPGRLQRLEVLIDGGVADVAALIVQLLEDVAGGEMAFLVPEQIQHHAPLAAEPHAQLTAPLVDLLHMGRCRGHRMAITGFAAAARGRG